MVIIKSSRSKPIIPPSLTRQQGFVLIVSLVFLVALTGVAAALMQNTTSDMKMAGATNEKVVATQAALSAIDEVIDNQINVRTTNLFTQSLEKVNTYTSADLLPATSKTKATASVSLSVSNPSTEEVPCPRARVSSSVGIIECNIMQLQVQRAYGRNDTSNIAVNTNIVQQLLSDN